VLYRIYDKEDYGTLGLYVAILGVVGVFSTMQYTQAILIAKEDEEAKKVLWLNRFINIAFTIFSILIVLILGQHIGGWLGNPKVNTWLWLLPVSIFFSGQNQIYRTWANRKKHYKLLSLNSILLAVLIPIVSISVGIFNNGPLGLFLGLAVSQVVPPIILYFALNKSQNLVINRINFDDMKSIGLKYINLPKFSTPAEFLNRFSNQLPVFMISTYAGPSTVGVYNLSVRMLGLPVQLISSAIAEVFRQRATEDFNITGSCRDIFVKTAKSLTYLSIIPLIVLLFYAPDLFAFVFSENWRQAGVFAQILALFYAFKFVVSPLTFLFVLRDRLKEDMLWHIWMLLSTAVVFIIGFKVFNDINLSLGLFTINYIIIYLIYLIRSYQFTT
ncbi:MAG: oligosaccharide flippase family protein, partial [Romboutsia sp.]|nr:oligosaccharide flippase family protein [Romboutsia sp.]